MIPVIVAHFIPYSSSLSLRLPYLDITNDIQCHFSFGLSLYCLSYLAEKVHSFLKSLDIDVTEVHDYFGDMRKVLEVKVLLAMGFRSLLTNFYLIMIFISEIKISTLY